MGGMLACCRATSVKNEDAPSAPPAASAAPAPVPMPAEGFEIEQSESFPSPSGACSVSVSSVTQTSGKGQSQPIVSDSMGGGGLIALEAPRAAFGFVWKGDLELEVQYPRELPAPGIDATNTSFRCGSGRFGSVRYEAVPSARLRPLHWTKAGGLRVLEETRLERGTLVATESGGSVEYSYSYYDVREPDSSAAALQRRGFQGGGESWKGIIYGLVALRAPTIAGALAYDPESDGLAIRSRNRDALRKVAELVAKAKADSKLLDAAIARAVAAGEME